jgi:hypothetical protein
MKRIRDYNTYGTYYPVDTELVNYITNYLLEGVVEEDVEVDLNPFNLQLNTKLILTD